MSETGDHYGGRNKADAMLLKTIPPRSPQAFLVRSQIGLDRIRIAGIDLIEISAPHGFGKTSQMAQWHREALVAGLSPIWLSLDSRDDPSRLIRALTQATVRASTSAVLSPNFVDWIGTCSDPFEAATAWLSEIARSIGDTFLLIDDVDHAPEQTIRTLEYIFANAPPNLRIAFAGRPSMSRSPSGILDSIPFMRITARDLRFREEETIRLVQQTLSRFDGDVAARIHAITEGWPLGVRLAIASQLRSTSPVNLDRIVTADIGQYFLDSVIDRLPEQTAQMLVDIARLEPIHPELCRAVLSGDPPTEEIERLAGETPIFSRGDTGSWFSLHPSAREVLIPRQEQRPAKLRREQALRARDWYKDQGMLEEAARQARLGGDEVSALALAESSLRDMTLQGRNSEVLEWYARFSPAEIADHPGFWVPAGWALALSNRVGEVRPLMSLLRGSATSSHAERYEADLILAACAGYGDDLMHMEEFAHRWPAPPAWAGASEIILHAVSLSHRALLNGHTNLARQYLVAPLSDRATTAPASWSYADLIMGLSYFWEGKVQLATETLTPALALAEEHMHSRNRIVSMIAAILAASCLACDRPEEARRHLSLRIKTVEREGIPESVIALFTTLAEIADDEGRQDQAAVQYASLAAEGRARQNGRMEAAALAGLASLHARHGRIASASQEAEKAEALVAALDDKTAPTVRRWCQLHASLARASVADREGKHQAAQAEEHAARALMLAMKLNRGAETARALFLRAHARERLKNDGADLDRTEAISLCEAGGLLRLRREFDTSANAGKQPPAATPAPVPTPTIIGSRTVDGSMLTPREQDVLVRLVNHMSNKEIARSMGLGEETVKWHLKNLFQKLGAGDRKSAVIRARMLGLI